MDWDGGNMQRCVEGDKGSFKAEYILKDGSISGTHDILKFVINVSANELKY